MDVPFWALSPSPFSLFFYCLLIFVAYRKLKPYIVAKRWRRLVGLTDSLFIVGFVVVLCDTLWILASGLRFGSSFPESVLQLVFCFFRDVAALIFCSLFIYHYFKRGMLGFSESFWCWILVNVVFLAVWFHSAPNPAYTDWTFAIRHGYSLKVIAQSFISSHIIGRIITFLIFYSLFNDSPN